MDYNIVFDDLKTKFPSITIKKDHPLAPYTTLRIGGPADIFIHTKNQSEFIDILKFLSSLIEDRRLKIEDLIILGNGSNVLISDKGLRGIVIKNSSNQIDIFDDVRARRDSPSSFKKTYTQRNENEPEKYLDFTKLDYDESDKPQVLVKITSGTPLPFSLNFLLDNGITGLQWFSYIPGTVGGATWYNIHGGSYHFADYIDSIDVFDLNDSSIRSLLASDLSWKYEKSYFQENSNLIILSTTLRLFRGDADLAKKVRDAWIAQKVKVQPVNSAGSAFANPSLETCQKIWGEQKSTGWIIDHELNMKGTNIGDAQISLQHANFIVNNGHAKASDYYALLKMIQSKVKDKFGFDLVPEVKLLGEF